MACYPLPVQNQIGVGTLKDYRAWVNRIMWLKLPQCRFGF